MTVKKKRKTYDGAFKAQVVSEFIRGKKNLDDLANQYDLHPNQIKNWKSILLKRADIIFKDKRRSKC